MGMEYVAPPESDTSPEAWICPTGGPVSIIQENNLKSMHTRPESISNIPTILPADGIYQCQPYTRAGIIFIQHRKPLKKPCFIELLIA